MCVFICAHGDSGRMTVMCVCGCACGNDCVRAAVRVCVCVCLCLWGGVGATFSKVLFLEICMARFMGLLWQSACINHVGTTGVQIVVLHHCSFSSSAVSVSSSSSEDKLSNNLSPSDGSSPSSLKRRSKISFFFRHA